MRWLEWHHVSLGELRELVMDRDGSPKRAGLQSKHPWGLIFPVLDPQVGEADVGCGNRLPRQSRDCVSLSEAVCRPRAELLSRALLPLLVLTRREH